MTDIARACWLAGLTRLEARSYINDAYGGGFATSAFLLTDRTYDEMDSKLKEMTQ